MALDTAGDASSILSGINNFIKTTPQADLGFLGNLASVIDTGFQKATPSMTNVDITTPAGSLVFPMAGKSSSQFPKVVGQACADYWSLAITPGTPAVKQSITSVANDAAKIAKPIEANIIALATGSYRTPYYLDFVNAIHKEVLTIKWSVVEKTVNSTTLTVTVT